MFTSKPAKRKAFSPINAPSAESTLSDPARAERRLQKEFAEFLAVREKRNTCTHRSTGSQRPMYRSDFCPACGTQLRKVVN